MSGGSGSVMCVTSMKTHLTKVLAEQLHFYDEFIIILTQVEALLSSRLVRYSFCPRLASRQKIVARPNCSIYLETLTYRISVQN